MKRTHQVVLWAPALALVALATMTCRVDVPADAKLYCQTNDDCGGSDFTCVTGGASSGFCCQVSGEVCDGRDNDCDGLVDNLSSDSCYSGPPGTEGIGACRAGVQGCVNGAPGCAGEVVPSTEVCNTADDNCDGVEDEGFDLTTDVNNCRTCANTCNPGERCGPSGCFTPMEGDCCDGLDDEADGTTDCADSDCGGQTCAAGYRCQGLQRRENECFDGIDNDAWNGGDAIDCADTPDCDGRPCAPDAGCTCALGAKREGLCCDRADNDSDGLLDCVDLDCANQTCDLVTHGYGCSTAGGTTVETNCSDGLDNDVFGGASDGIDCADQPDCNGRACGTSCACDAGVKWETNCRDGIDNDGNEGIDCADPNCNNQYCAQSCGSNTSCICAGGAKQENACNTGDNCDNDGDNLFNCNDPSCLNKSCGNGGRVCRSNGSCN